MKIKTTSYKIRKNVIIALTLCLILGVTAFCGIFLNNKKETVLASVQITNESIKDSYFLNETVDFPKEIVENYNGTDKTFKNGVIVFPNNASFWVDKMILNQHGEYTLIYYNYDNDVTIEAKKTFIVNDYLYNLTAQNGTITALTSEKQAGKTLNSNEDNVLVNKEDGLIVRMGEKNTFNYNLSLDLNDVDENGLYNIATMDYRLSDFVPNPDYDESSKHPAWVKYNPESESAEFCIIRLTDIYDETNFVELSFYYGGIYNNPYYPNSDSNPNNYWQATFTAGATGSTGQLRTGGYIPKLDEKPNQYIIPITVDDIEYYCFTGAGEYAMRNGAKPEDGHLRSDHVPFAWKYDPLNHRVYVQKGNDLTFVTELSNSTLYGEKVFKGFTDNKVNLSIYTEGSLSDNYARFDITSIGKQSGTELVNYFEKARPEDEIGKPKIELDVENTDVDGIYAPINRYFTLPIPSINGGKITDYKVNVYLNYGNENQLDVPVKDNKFFISANLLYTVKYTAVNEKGIKGEKTLLVNGVYSNDAINVDFNLEGCTLNAGVKFTLPQYQIETINDKNKVSVSIFAVSEKQTVEIKDNSFIPTSVGKYEIVFKCKDNAFEVEKRFEIFSQPSNAVFFDGGMILPKYFMKDANYSLEKINAYEFVDNDIVTIDYKAEISFDSENSFVPINNIDNVKITGSDYAVIRYICQSTKNPEIKEFVTSDKIKIINLYNSSNVLASENYFIYDNFNVVPYDQHTNRDTSIKFDSTLSTGNNAIKFINAVNISDLTLQLKTTLNYAKYKQLKITLRDYVDESKQFFLSIVDQGTTSILNINDEKSLKYNSVFASNDIKKISYSLVAKTFSVDTTSTEVDLSKYFSTNLVYVEIELVEIYGMASLIVDQINLQNFRHNIQDSIGPKISAEDFTEEFVVGSIVTIPSPVATDVFGTVIKENVTVTVKKDDVTINATDGTPLNKLNAYKGYQFEITDFGLYRITYTATDSNGRYNNFSLTIACMDNQAPVIEFTGNYSETVSVGIGEAITVQFNVSDNVSAPEDIHVSYMAREKSSNAIVTFAENGFSLKRKGEFEIIVYASDKSGNFTYKSFDLVVR